MKHFIVLFSALLSIVRQGAAQTQEPLYIVNGEPRSEIRSIPPDRIEHVETLPADEQTIARYGPQAAHGVMLITLYHDQAAEFTKGDFAAYIASQIRWDTDEPAARVILRYTVTADGRTLVDKELESTDARLRRRVLKAVEEAPGWRAATKNGTPVPSTGILRIQLPTGKQLHREPEVVYR